MKKLPLLALALSCWLTAPAHAAGKITLTCPDAAITVNVAGEYTIACSGALVPPTTTPPVVPPAVPPPVAGLCPVLPGVVMVTPETRSKAKELIAPGNVGQATIFSLALPGMPAGTLSTTRQPSTPPSMQMRIFVSKCPGDPTYSQGAAAQFKYDWWPVPYFPCMAPGSAESAALWWGSTVGQNTCAVNAGTAWYVNMQTSDAAGANTCTSPGGCPFIFWWN